MNSHKQGFTLIELLIVVAIIAILAAIAIPNFLAAQVRSKVSRVKADIRTAATAVESYYIDYNDYPKSVPVAQVFSGSRNSAYSYLPDTITTPVSYISNNKIVDAFAQGIYQDPYSRLFWQNTKYLQNPAFNPSHTDWYDPIFEVAYGYWKVGSLGPNADYDGGYNIYDPTNGTISNGDIYRTQKQPEGSID